MARGQSHAAYDFELFEAKSAKKQPTLNVVKEEKYRKRDVKSVVKLVSMILVGVVVICYMLYSRAQLTELTQQIGSFNDNYDELCSEYTRLSAELEGKVSLRNVEENAKAMGLAKIQSYQVSYVNIEEDDGFVNPSQDDLAPTFADKVSLYIQSFLEYIRIR